MKHSFKSKMDHIFSFKSNFLFKFINFFININYYSGTNNTPSIELKNLQFEVQNFSTLSFDNVFIKITENIVFESFFNVTGGIISFRVLY